MRSVFRVLAVLSASGRVAGTIVARGPQHTIPVPEEAIRDGRVELRFEVRQKGLAPRKPSAAEVVSAKVDFVPAARPE